MAIQDLSQVLRKTPPRLNFYVAQQVENENPFEQLSFADLFRQHPFLPDRTAILGVCEDGLPVLLDFTDPKPGSLLVGSSDFAGIRKLLQLAVFSTLARTPPADIEIHILSNDPDHWLSFPDVGQYDRYEVIPAYDRAAGASILQTGNHLEQRLYGRTGEGIELLVVDDLNAISRSDYDVQSNFEWLTREGPRHQIWILAGLQAGQIEQNDRFLAPFQTRVLGQVDDPACAVWLANARPPDTTQFHPTQQFSVRINRNWMNFWLPGR